MFLEKGKIVSIGKPDEVVSAYQNYFKNQI